MSQEKLEAMKEGGQRLARVFKKTLAFVRPGITTLEIDKIADDLIAKEGGEPSFKAVKDYRWATCININEGVVHGIPGPRKIKEGDLVSLDLGMYFDGWHTDMAWTVLVPGSEGNKEKNIFLTAGKKALKEAIKVSQVGNRIGHISQAIEKEINKAHFHPVTNLTGHGVGISLHEDPKIPCFFKGDIQKTELIEEDMSLALEIIYTQKSPELVIKNDGWTIETADGFLAGLFEDTIFVTKKGPINLTSLPLD